MAINLKVNGATCTVPAEPDTPLLYVLRNDWRSTPPSSAAGWPSAAPAPCWSTGKPVRSCVTPIGSLGGCPRSRRSKASGTIDKPHPLQKSIHGCAGRAMRLLHSAG